MKKYSRKWSTRKARKNRTRKIKAGMFRRPKVVPYRGDDMSELPKSSIKHKPESDDPLDIKQILMNTKNEILVGQLPTKGKSYYKVKLVNKEEINDVLSLMADYRYYHTDSNLKTIESKLEKDKTGKVNVIKIGDYNGKYDKTCVYIEINKEEMHDANFADYFEYR